MRVILAVQRGYRSLAAVVFPDKPSYQRVSATAWMWILIIFRWP